jgi:BirA family biotin operon repressor/biotin-[acetyl-CoA-carboxylase] ligase
MLKWPNDLIVRDRKVGGLLGEARWQGTSISWVAIGLGLNVRNPVPAELADRAVALREFCGETTVDALAAPLASALAGVDLVSPRLSTGELEEFTRRDWLSGRRVVAPRAGTASGIERDGSLIVRDHSGANHRVRLGEVLVG